MDIHFTHNGQVFVATPIADEINAKQEHGIYNTDDVKVDSIVIDFSQNPDAQLEKWSAYN